MREIISSFLAKYFFEVIRRNLRYKTTETYLIIFVFINIKLSTNFTKNNKANSIILVIRKLKTKYFHSSYVY